MNHAVPPGSILGPFLFHLYAPTRQNYAKNKIAYHSYAEYTHSSIIKPLQLDRLYACAEIKLKKKK